MSFCKPLPAIVTAHAHYVTMVTEPPAIICFGGERASLGFYRIDYIYFYLNKLNCLKIFRVGKIHDNILLFQQN